MARQAPDRAGTLGPDAYPDILTGQQVIHPAGAVSPGETSVDLNPGGPGPGPWLQRLYDLAYGNAGVANDRTPQNRAFVAGFMAHAAGDTYGHTFINAFTGGAFHFLPLPENAIKHVVLEG